MAAPVTVGARVARAETHLVRGFSLGYIRRAADIPSAAIPRLTPGIRGRRLLFPTTPADSSPANTTIFCRLVRAGPLVRGARVALSAARRPDFSGRDAREVS
jgi:hypothetical protein